MVLSQMVTYLCVEVGWRGDSPGPHGVDHTVLQNRRVVLERLLHFRTHRLPQVGGQSILHANKKYNNSRVPFYSLINLTGNKMR